MIDEPFLGLAPKIVEDLGGLLRRIRDEQGIGILFIEQNVELRCGWPTAAISWNPAAPS
jgi:branched-chain amino acid transport system ATP-binding protein